METWRRSPCQSPSVRSGLNIRRGQVAARILGRNHGHRYCDWRYENGAFRFFEHRVHFTRDQVYEGKYIIQTGEPTLSAVDAVRLYKDVRLYKELSEVERAFAGLKDVLDLRPIYHQTDYRVRLTSTWLRDNVRLTPTHTGTPRTWRRAAVLTFSRQPLVVIGWGDFPTGYLPIGALPTGTLPIGALPTTGAGGGGGGCGRSAAAAAFNVASDAATMRRFIGRSLCYGCCDLYRRTKMAGKLAVQSRLSIVSTARRDAVRFLEKMLQKGHFVPVICSFKSDGAPFTVQRLCPAIQRAP